MSKVITLKLSTGTIELMPDQFGLYNLHEVWVNLGGKTENRPTNWVSTEEAKGIIDSYQKSVGEDQVVLGIPKNDSIPFIWAIEPIVYAYASWACPEFHAHMLSVFKDMVNGKE